MPNRCRDADSGCQQQDQAGTPQGAVPAAAIANMTADAETATSRSGPTLLPARSLQMPTTMRPSAPTNWEIPIRSPAGAASHPCSLISQTRPNVERVNCGNTSSAETT